MVFPLYVDALVGDNVRLTKVLFTVTIDYHLWGQFLVLWRGDVWHGCHRTLWTLGPSVHGRIVFAYSHVRSNLSECPEGLFIVSIRNI